MARKGGEVRNFFNVEMVMPPDVAKELLELRGIKPDRYDDLMRVKELDANGFHNEKAMVVIALGGEPRVFDAVFREVRRGKHDLPGHPSRYGFGIVDPKGESLRRVFARCIKIEREGD
jgi:hypothetical protein